MELRTVRRGLVTLAIAATLGIAGAHPASAAERGWFERSLSWLAGFWAAEDTAAKAQPDDGLLSWVMNTDKGMGLDPNGDGSQSVVPPPGEDR